ncbi:hypothetical protein GH714_034794 [Hevea brasiliensis]|uniref:Disease resistance R13L4/SHOC-2-like LRR domain-containing protein n=1 Tax=Hevea brasiliensis TaxID=3981 RepID=A0A6A6MFL4_HEVBR|nr:hypothetical protein GH714_034794 [Hevea brasiliensis]
MLEERYVFYSKVKVPKLYEKSCLVEVEEQDFISKVANSLTHAFIKNDGQELPPNFNRFQIQSLFASVDYCDGHIGPLSQVFWQTVCGLQFLLVLNLYAAVEYLPDEVGDLVHLKYLLLSNSKMKKLPLTIGNLQKLQTLEVHDCSKQFELAVEILNIKQLRHLLLCDTLRYKGGIRVPMGIGTLVNLQTFTGVYVGAGIASELSCLTQLRKLDVQDVSEDHVGELFASIIKLENLVSLSLNAEQAGEGTLLPELEPFSPPPHLQELVLRGGLVEMLNWLPSIENLTSLALCHSNISENPSSVLQFLPKLKHLRLWEAYKVKLIGKEFCESGGFPKLETLIIASGDLVEWIEIVNGAFPSLRNLQFWNCLNLRFLPEGLQNISTIQELFLTHLHGDLERRLSGEENYKIKHISKFYWDMPIS